MAATVTVNDVLDGHVALDMECLDRIYLNGYVPNLQVGGQVASFMTRASGLSDPVAGDLGEDRHRVPQGGGRVRRGQPDPGGAVRQGRPQDRRDAAVSGPASGDRSGRGGRDRGGPGVRAGVRWRPSAPGGPRGVVLLHQGPAAGHLLLLLPLGRRFRAGVCQGVRLLPVSDEDLGQRARVGQAAGHQGRHRVHRAVQRVRHLHRSRLRCRRSATGSARARSGCSPNAGGRSCRCR